MGWMRAIVAALCLCVVPSFGSLLSHKLLIRGGLFPAAKNLDQYFQQFTFDYGIDDDRRLAGQMRGFVPSGKLLKLPHSDEFIKYLCQHLDLGAAVNKGKNRFSRLKAYHAADFGTKEELKKGENPKIIIVNRRLKADDSGVLLSAPKEIDVEVREIWQPWLKKKCNFVVRYIVPNRVNILKILESQGQFSNELVFEKNGAKKGKTQGCIQMTFRPRLFQRLLGYKNVVIKKYIDVFRES